MMLDLETIQRKVARMHVISDFTTTNTVISMLYLFDWSNGGEKSKGNHALQNNSSGNGFTNPTILHPMKSNFKHHSNVS